MYNNIQSYTYDQANVINAFRILTSKMAYLIRFYIVERITGLGNPEATFNELLQVPSEANQILRSIPGVTDDFTPVTAAYLTELKNLIDGMISGDQAKADESVRRLYERSDQDAEYLAQLNPIWDAGKWKDIFYRYNRDLVAEIIAIRSGDYDEALNIFESLMDIAHIAGDYYAEGFIQLLPEDQPQIPIAYLNMIKDLRDIGTERAYLTRFYMVAKIVGLFADINVTQKLFKLMSRLKEKFELVMGTEAAEELLRLLSMYVIRLEGLIDAILSGDEANIVAQTAEVDQFTGELAAFLGRINPYWDEATWNELFTRSAGLVVEQSYNLQRKEHIEAMKNFERFLYSSLAIDDYFALGLYQYTQDLGRTGMIIQ